MAKTEKPDNIKEFDWHSLKRPPAYPRDEVIRAVERKGSCGIPMVFEPIFIWFHSDGNLDSIFPELVETGIDVYNPLQPGAIDVERWRNRYKGKLTFYTGIDVQGMLPFASPRTVKEEIRKSVEKFSSDRGGFILGPTNAITAEVPYENLVALYEVLMEYR